MYVIDNGEKYAMTWLGKLFLLLLSTGCLAQATTPIRFVDASGIHHNPNNRYFIQLIDEAMAVTTSKYGAYELQPVDIDISQSRQLKELEKGTFDLYWTMATPAREYQLQSIPIALSKGSYGIRLLVVRKVDMPQLAFIREKEQLAEKVALSGEDWPDTAILRFNHFTVAAASKDVNLYPLLHREEQYYFPRGLFEADAELQAAQNQDFAILPQLVLRYPVEMRFYVAKNNNALAQRLTDGLMQLKQSGRFDQIFYQFAPHAAAIKRLNMADAKVLELNSPYEMTGEQLQVIYAEQDQLLQRFGIKNASRE